MRGFSKAAIVATAFSGSFCVITGCAFIYNFIFYSGNHWFLYGTPVDFVLFQYGYLCAAVIALPMLTPLLMKVSKQNIMVAIGGVIIFFFLSLLFMLIVD